MKPSELRYLLAGTIAARKPVLIAGAPGIGKSDIVAQAANEAGASIILSHPAVSDPTDVKGLPWIVDGHATFLPFGELSDALKADTPTVWFLDDLGQATPAVQASYMQLLLARRVNGHVLSDHVTFVGATNRRTDRCGVTGILEAVKSRFDTIVELEADANEWTQWALSHGIRPEVIAFLRFQPQLLSDFKPSADLVNSPSPRTWSHASGLLDILSGNKGVLRAALAGAVGEGAAVEFAAFLDMYATLPSVDAILMDGNFGTIPTSTSTLYALTSALAARSTPQNFAQGVRYAKRLMSAGHGEFSVLYVRDACKRTPKLTQTTTYVDLITQPDYAGLVS